MTTDVDQLAVDYWDGSLRRHPTFATAIGDRRFDALLEDETPAAQTAARMELDEFERRLGTLDGARDHVTAAALREALVADRAFLDADLAAFNVDPMDGPQVRLLNVASYHAARDEPEESALLERWAAMPRALDVAVENLRRGSGEGRTAVAALCAKVLEQLDDLLSRPDEDWPLVAPAADRPSLREPILGLIRGEIRPAFIRFRTAIADEAAPAARDDEHPGLVHVPGGEAAYRSLARAHTSLDTPPEEVHAIGLAEIERIDAELVALGAQVLRTDGLAATLSALRSDPSLRFTSREEVFATAAASLERANAAIGSWFGRLPQAPCEVVRIPAHEEKHTTIAYYREPSADGARPGQYYVNTYAPETRPRYEAETLAFHESVPGHHLQLAIMQELHHLPAFRRFNGSTAFIEGWGLYTERLSEEMGLLSGELDRFGVLSFDAWRAARLVVDTGMHAMGWSRQAAIEFLVAHTALGENNVANEVDRYIAYPGQALAYKLGQLEILRLRREAQHRQGDRFDIRAFHDTVLGEGALPLPVLREVVEGALR